MKTLQITQWAEEDRPREKMKTKGVSALTDAELLAVLLRSGTEKANAVELAQHVLSDCEGNLIELSHKQLGDLLQYDGIGEAKAMSLLAALELGRRRRASEAIRRKIIRTSADVYDYIQEKMSDLSLEEIWVITLKSNHQIQDRFFVSRGNSQAVSVDVKWIFKQMLQRNVAAFILCHNHPSDELSPSNQDIQLTKQVQQAARLLGFQMLDHLIVGSHTYFSFKDSGLL